MRKRTGILLAVVILLLIAVAGVYVGIGTHYQTHFFENTVINGINVSDLTVAEAEALIADEAEDYQLILTGKEGKTEVLTGVDIGYRFVSGGEVQSFLENQNFLAWLAAYLGDPIVYTMEAAVTWDENLLTEKVQSLSYFQEDQVTAPADAYVTRREDGVYEIVAEVEGNQLSVEKVEDLVKESVNSGQTTANLEEAGCYLEPSVRSDDGSLRAEAAVMNRYSSITITYQMGGDVTVTLDPDLVASWFTLDENKQPVFDREAVAAWVDQLADQYDTIGTWQPFVTSNGETIYPESRTYGWQMDRETETEELYKLLQAGDSTERTPVYLESARTRGENDIGNTYVEIDYTNQRMWYYKDGVLLVETPVVTGNVSADMASPEGVFCLVNKEEDATLKGEGYSTPVEYWMPFYGGVGIHDADSWRTAYGGDIYMWSGSHGCINTPTAQAAIIYQNIDIGTPIVCYSSGINYGYGQTGSTGGGQTGTTDGSGDIVILDGGTVDTDGQQQTDAAQQTPETSPGDAEGSADIIIEDWADESVYYGQ